MKLIKEIYRRNIILARLGTAHLILALLLLMYLPFNDAVVLGLNSVVKPIKFALSITIYSYTMAWLLYYLNNQKKVRWYSWVAVVAMGFEQLAITFQALRGQQSHFNHASVFGAVLYALMGVFIVTLILCTAYMAYLFIRQRTWTINRSYLLGIRIGIIYFIVFSFFGSYVAAQPGHSVGGTDGGTGMPFVNWSSLLGDLRVAHFFGIHSLQVIPVFAWFTIKKMNEHKSIPVIWIFSIVYLILILYTMIQALNGHPFIAIR